LSAGRAPVTPRRLRVVLDFAPLAHQHAFFEMRPERSVIGVENFFRIGRVFAFSADLALDAFGRGFPRRPAGRSFLAQHGFEGCSSKMP